MLSVHVLTEADRERILAYAYREERAHVFVISSFVRYVSPFVSNTYLSAFDASGDLLGLGALFGRFKSFSISGSAEGIAGIVDAVYARNLPLEWMPGPERYVLPAVERLRSHGLTPLRIRRETLYGLTRDRFCNRASGHVVRATAADIDDIVRLERLAEERDVQAVITLEDRARIVLDGEWILRHGGELIARACLHGVTARYAQLGGVMTHPRHRGRGYAKDVVSTLCRHFLDQGKEVQLFCKDDNVPALAVYRSLGFVPIEPFPVVQYSPQH